MKCNIQESEDQTVPCDLRGLSEGIAITTVLNAR